MINFTFNGEDKEKVISTFISELDKAIMSCNAQTLAANYYDSPEEREEALRELVSDDDEGFLFDEESSGIYLFLPSKVLTKPFSFAKAEICLRVVAEYKP